MTQKKTEIVIPLRKEAIYSSKTYFPQKTRNVYLWDKLREIEQPWNVDICLVALLTLGLCLQNLF